MSIVKEQEIKNKVTAKGILVCVDDEGLHIKDSKSEEIDVLSFDDFKMFLNKTISFSVADSTKKEIEEDEEGEVEE
jgi:hypothetical protein